MILERQKRQIKRFIRKKGRKQIDAFGVYLWIERCHYQGWWDLGVELASYLPPNSLRPDYQKRLEYLIGECRNKLAAEFVSVKSPLGTKDFYVPTKFWKICEEQGLNLGGKSNRWLRLEYEGQEVIILERIRLEGCLLKFSKWNRERLIEWLTNHGHTHLCSNVLPRGEKVARNSWLRLNWGDATDLIPDLKEVAHSKIEESNKAFIDALRKMPVESRQRVIFAHKLYNALEQKGLFFHDISLRYSGVRIKIDRRHGVDLFCTAFEHLIRVGISINRGSKQKEENKALFDKLFANKIHIEEDFGAPLSWERLNDKAGCRISALIDIGGYKDAKKWPEIEATLIIRLKKLENILAWISTDNYSPKSRGV